MLMFLFGNNKEFRVPCILSMKEHFLIQTISYFSDYFLGKLQGDPILIRMLNLGEFYSNNIHVNISTELQATQGKFHNFPASVKQELEKNKDGEERKNKNISQNILNSPKFQNSGL